ncbi:MAG: type II toxin-antitoxin system VapC family toxin [Prevotellaceae bacterium]|jgi:predicted nucleic acid-binding protein|nr:type II toxin-antitoxin system VapC family toxin [Prevotellaceae bacterium]
MKSKIYLDTSVISALFDDRTPERLLMTNEMWLKLSDYDVYISGLVIEELERTSEHVQQKMLAAVCNFTFLSVTKESQKLADIYVKQGIFPEKYYDDALHVAIASVNQIGILLSWNFTHLVKLKTRRMVSIVNLTENFATVEIISPPEL